MLISIWVKVEGTYNCILQNICEWPKLAKTKLDPIGRKSVMKSGQSLAVLYLSKNDLPVKVKGKEWLK
jgi:hypothetical protein